jgi:hypothetical protein
MRSAVFFSILLFCLVAASSAAIWQLYFRPSPVAWRHGSTVLAKNIHPQPRINETRLASFPIPPTQSNAAEDAESEPLVLSATIKEILATLSPTAAAAAATTAAAATAAANAATAATAAAAPTAAPPANTEWLQGGKHELLMIDDSFMLPAFEPSTALDPPVIGFGKYLNQKIQLSLESSEVHKNSNPLHQAAVFDLLRAASTVFDALNISYFLSHGTLLGAFRHGDMLKWDYDIDSTLRLQFSPTRDLFRICHCRLTLCFLSLLLHCAVVLFKEHMQDETGKCIAHMYHMHAALCILCLSTNPPCRISHSNSNAQAPASMPSWLRGALPLKNIIFVETNRTVCQSRVVQCHE